MISGWYKSLSNCFIFILLFILILSFPSYSKSIDQAKSSMEEGIQLTSKTAEEIDDKRRVGDAFIVTGSFYYSIGDYSKALNYYQQALKAYEEIGDKSGVGNASGSIGLVYYSLGDYPKALDYYQRALKILEEINDRSGVGDTFISIGAVYDSLGDYLKALDCYQQALKITEEVGDKSKIENAFGNIGSVYYNLGDHPKALDYFQRALKIAEEVGDRGGVAGFFNNIGVVYDSFGDYSKALDYHQRALKIKEELGDKGGVGNAFINIGVVYYHLGDYSRALDYYQRALKIYEKIRDKSGVGDALGNIGIVYYHLCDYSKALDYYQRALKIKEGIGDKSGVGKTLGNIGLVYDSLGDYLKALDCYQRTLKIAEEIGDKIGVETTFNNIGSVYGSLGDYSKALDCYQGSLKIAEEIGDKEGVGIVFNNIGTCYNFLGDCQKALDYYQRALKIAEETGNLSGIFMNFAGMGISYKKLNKDDEAINCLSRSIKTLEEIRGKLKVEEQKMSFMQDKMVIYEELIELLIKKGRKEDAWEYTERAKARTFLDMMGNQKIDFKTGASPELMKKEEELSRQITAVTGQIEKEGNAEDRDKLNSRLKELKKEYEETIEKLKISNPEYASLRIVEVSPFKEIQKTLDKDTLLLEYFIGEEKSYLFIIDKDNLKVVVIPENDEQIKEKVSEILMRVTKKAPLKDEAKSLSAILIKPALEEMKGKKKLIIVPHSALHYLPFAMLADSNGDYLAENYQILTQPSASVWMLCLKKERGKGERLAAYAIGDVAVSFGEKKKTQKEVSVRGTIVMSPEVLREGLSPLQWTKEEVKKIGEFYPGGTVLVGKQATISRVKQSAGKGNLLHFATHGILDSAHPLFSGLVFYDGILTTSDIFGLDLKANLVVLSACNTAGGKISHGDEIVGMSRAFMYAGTPTVVASLWSISDVSTAQFMKDFYRKLKEGKSKGEALQEAQKDMMKNAEYSHPYYWAPFILIGDGGRN